MAKILVVDDSPTMRNLVRRPLESSAHEVLEASNGAAGLAQVMENPVDLVVTDINMPHMNGFQMIAAVRDARPKSELPIIVLTTETSETSKGKLRDLGANAWIAKPFDDTVFMNIVNQHLS